MPRRLVLALLVPCLALVAACGPSPAPAAPPAALAASPTLPPATSEPVPAASPTPPPATAAASSTPLPSPARSPLPAPSATPAPKAPRVGLQVGHWKMKQLPDELARIRGDSGTYYRGFDEWEINIEVATRLQRRLEDAGVIVDLLPATVPVAYQADAFVALHCDGASGASAAARRGWKAATPFRASEASEALLEAVDESYGRVTGLPPDTRGASLDMRAYYAFASYRYQHAIAPTTPAIIVETGFVTYPGDRALLFDNPDLVAQGIAEGLLAFLADPTPVSATPPALPALRVGAGVALFARPSQSASVVRKLERGEPLVTLSQIDGWYLVTTRNGWDIGWVSAEDVEA